MLFAKRDYCVQYENGRVECFAGGGFWYTDKGIIIKWIILGSIFAFFLLWFVGGYIHAMRRLKAGKKLLGYHRFLVSYQTRKRYGQAGPPQNHFTFYQSSQPYFNQQQNQPYRQRQDGTWPEPPPQYMGNDAPPQYYAPPNAAKPAGEGMEMPVYGSQAPPMGGVPQGGQSNGVVRNENGDVEQGHGQGNGQQSGMLPPRPAAVKDKVMGVLSRFRK